MSITTLPLLLFMLLGIAQDPGSSNKVDLGKSSTSRMVKR